MFMFNSDLKNIGKAACYARNWRGKVAPTISEVSQIILKYPNSPCMWAGGVRKKDNFRYSEWLMLDFDEGLSLNEAKEIFQPYLHLIATTKSHQIEKKGKIEDRFRVVIKLDKTLSTAQDYEATVRKYVSKWGADTACVDAAHFFWPCREVVQMQYMGVVLPTVDAEQIQERRDAAEKKRKKNWDMVYRTDKVIPPRVQNRLTYGVADGCRNIACYGIGADLGYLGFSFEEIFSLVMSSAIPISNEAKVTKEVAASIRSGMNKNR
jgi:hypothetical protein